MNINKKMMRNNIQKFINEIETQTNKEDAFLGFFLYGGDIDESYIKANKEGLKLYAVELLKAVLKQENSENEISYNISADFEDENSDFHIDFIELIKEKHSEIASISKGEKTFTDKIFGFGCWVAFILIVLIFLTGLGTVLSWLIN